MNGTMMTSQSNLWPDRSLGGQLAARPLTPASPWKALGTLGSRCLENGAYFLKVTRSFIRLSLAAPSPTPVVLVVLKCNWKSLVGLPVLASAAASFVRKTHQKKSNKDRLFKVRSVKGEFLAHNSVFMIWIEKDYITQTGGIKKQTKTSIIQCKFDITFSNFARWKL